MSKNNLPKGKLGEDLASNFLKEKAYRIIDRNFHSRTGEIDLIATNKGILVFVEVKTRWNASYGRPEESVTPWKIKSIISAAQYFKLLHPELPAALQIDVVAVELDGRNQSKTITHLQNVTG